MSRNRKGIRMNGIIYYPNGYFKIHHNTKIKDDTVLNLEGCVIKPFGYFLTIPSGSITLNLKDVRLIIEDSLIIKGGEIISSADRTDYGKQDIDVNNGNAIIE